MWPTLNWREIEKLAGHLRQELLPAGSRGVTVERVYVPDRPRAPGGYFKSEWALGLSGGAKRDLFFAVRPRRPYVALLPSMRVSARATQSPFSLALHKQLRGARLTGVEALPRERVLKLSLQGGPRERWALFLSLIPTAPEAVFVTDDGSSPLPVLARSRANAPAEFTLPDGARAPKDLPLRAEWLDGPGGWSATLARALDEDCFELRTAELGRQLREAVGHARDRLRQSETAVAEARREAPWRRLADALKVAVHDLPEPRDGAWTLPAYDAEEGATVSVPCDARVPAVDQIQRLYDKAKRRDRREQEAAGRAERFRAQIARLEPWTRELVPPGDWTELGRREDAVGIARAGTAPDPARPASAKKRGGGWDGRAFLSRDKLPIWVGKTRDENLALTFKHAKGNDIWMHLRGRPSAHVVIPIPSGKSAPLETLLDAAQLLIHYTGGAGAAAWGTTEVDYTYKKHVKRIRDSTEASYVQNKTLLVQPEPARLKRLLDQQGAD